MCGVASAPAADRGAFYTESGIRPPPAALEEAARIHRALEAQWRRVLAERAGRLPHARGEDQVARHKEALREAQRSGQQYARIFPYRQGVLAETTRRIVSAAKRWSAVDVHVIAVVDPRRPRTVPNLGVGARGSRQPASSALAPAGDAFIVRYIDFLGRRASRFGVKRLPAAVYHHQGKWRLLDEQAVLAWLERPAPTTRRGGNPR